MHYLMALLACVMGAAWWGQCLAARPTSLTERHTLQISVEPVRTGGRVGLGRSTVGVASAWGEGKSFQNYAPRCAGLSGRAGTRGRTVGTVASAQGEGKCSSKMERSR